MASFLLQSQRMSTAGVQSALWTMRWKDAAHCHVNIAFALKVSSTQVAAIPVLAAIICNPCPTKSDIIQTVYEDYEGIAL